MYKPVSVITVRLWDTDMGAVALDPGLGYDVFEYDPAFIRKGLEPAPLTMPLSRSFRWERRRVVPEPKRLLP